jgi:hypothetical protein
MDQTIHDELQLYLYLKVKMMVLFFHLSQLIFVLYKNMAVGVRARYRKDTPTPRRN